VQPGAADAIQRALESFALYWDGEVVFQSRRTALYEEALRRLGEKVYGCGCSRREIADSTLSLAADGAAIYPGTCRAGLPPGRTARALRVRSDGDTVRFVDRVQGPQAQDVAREVGDFVLRRADGPFAYQLAVVVDDAEQGVTDVVRGADLLASTPRQILLQRALGYPLPRYLHFPVATDARGEKLSKQSLAPALEGAGAAALLPAALAFLGQPPAAGATPAEMLADAVRRWDPARIPRGAAAVPESHRSVTPRGV
jgi:glutamyl-Q tRNA(Asp) synthetase